MLFSLFSELLSAFFSVNENIIGIAQMFFPLLPDFAVASPVVKFELVQVFQKLLVKFGLQLLSKSGEQLRRFRAKQPGLPQRVAMLDDCSERRIEFMQRAVNRGFIDSFH